MLIRSEEDQFSATADAMLIRSEEDQRQQSTTLSITSTFEDDTKIEVKPFLSRSSSSVDVSSTCKFYRVWRRRIASDTSLSFLPGSPRRLSFQQDVRRAAFDTYLVTRLAFKLLRYLGVGYRWISKFLALGCYAFLLIPGFIQVGYYYFFSNQVIRGIVYGDQPRNRLDLYMPKKSDGPKPVIAFVTGGAWIIGYKAWGSLLGQQLSERDIIVACIDYRNFPQGTISDMVKDASQGISFVCNNIAAYGGDPNRIYLMGQSAGAHIAACALVDQAIKEVGGGSISWSVTQLKSYFGLSGGYNLFNLVDHFHSRGLYRSIFLSIMEGEQSLKRFSPEVLVQDTRVRNAGPLLPPIILFHGNADYSIPSDSSKTFAEALQRVGANAKTVLYDGKTHTDLFLQVLIGRESQLSPILIFDQPISTRHMALNGHASIPLVLNGGPIVIHRTKFRYQFDKVAKVQDPMRGGKDELFEDLVSSIHAGDSEALAKHAAAPLRRRLVPEFMLKLARSISPF